MLFITVVGNPVQQTQGHSCGIWWLGALANFILISHPVNTYKRCFVWCCLYAGSGHIPTETPPSTPKTSYLQSQDPESRYWGRAASLWPSATVAGAETLYILATVEGAETLYIYIKKTCYEYELDWGYQSQVLTVTPTPAPSTSLLGPIEHIIRLELHPFDH